MKPEKRVLKLYIQGLVQNYIVTTSFYIKNYNSFAPSPQYTFASNWHGKAHAYMGVGVDMAAEIITHNTCSC